MSTPAAPGRRRILGRWRLVSPTGAKVVSLRQLPKRERARLLAPSAFTTLNMMSGLSSVLLAFRGHFTLAAALIAVSIVLDIADGFVARLIGATSPFGLQLDSLADLISFGLAPAVLIHTWALDEWPVLAWLAAFLWLSCAAFRLARFNVTIDPMADKRYFVGLPSPGAAAVVMATILALDSPHWGPGTGPWRAWFPLLVAVVPALLMVMTVRFRSFRNLLAPQTARARAGTAAVVRRHRRRARPRARPDGPRRRLRLRPHRPARRAHRPAARAAPRGRLGRAAAPPDAVGVPADRRGRRGGRRPRTRRRRRSPGAPPATRDHRLNDPVVAQRLGEPSFDLRAAIT